MSFAERLRISRKEKGLSQEQLAEELELSRQSITKWETGLAYPVKTHGGRLCLQRQQAQK